MKKKNIIIFCQAPADITHLLSIYDKYNLESEISIFVVNVEGVYNFLCDLNLNLSRLIYIPYQNISIKNIFKLYKEKQRIKKLFLKHFYKANGCDVYFFSRFEDWLTATLVYNISLNHNVVINYVNHYDHSASLFKKNRRMSLRTILYLIALKYISNIWFKADVIEKIPEFPYYNYKINEISFAVDHKSLSKYKFTVEKVENNNNSVLFFISPCEQSIFDKEMYDIMLFKIVHILKNIGYTIYAKGHPRLGLPVNIRESIDNVIPDYIPGEFLHTEKFNLILGIDSTVIANYSKSFLNTYSLLKLFPPNNINLHKIAKKYLIQQSESNIKFLETENDLFIMANQIKN